MTRVLDSRRSRLTSLPFVGPMWYHRVAVEFLLHRGLINWACISHSFSATGRLPPDVFREVLEKMENAWPLDSPLRKSSINCMQGLWQINGLDSFSVRTTAFDTDGGDHWAEKRLFECDGVTLFDFVYQTRRVCNEAMRPIHDQIMHTEATRVRRFAGCSKGWECPPSASAP